MAFDQSWRSSTGFIIMVVSMAVFTDVFFYGLVVPVLPAVLKYRFNLTVGEEQLWNSILLAVYGGANLLASPIAGFLADRSSSRQRPLLIGLASMAGATLLLQLGSTLYALLAARIFQGIAAALLYSAGLAMLCDSVGKDRLGQAMGYITLAITAATFVGPTLGGVLFEAGGEVAVFVSAYAVIAIDLVARLAVVEHKDSSKSLLDTHSTSYGTMQGQSPGLSENDSLPADHKPQGKPVILILLGTWRLLIPLFGWLVLGIFLSAFDSILPIFVISTYGWSYAGAGLVFLPLFIPNLAGPLYGRLVDSSPRGPRFMGAAGFILCIVPFVLLRLVDNTETWAKWVFGALLLVIGFGLAIAGPPLLVEIFGTVEAIGKEDPTLLGDRGATAQAYGLYNAALAAGQLLGALLGGLTLQRFGWAFLTAAFGVVSGVTGIIILLCLGGLLWRSGRAQ